MSKREFVQNGASFANRCPHLVLTAASVLGFAGLANQAAGQPAAQQPHALGFFEGLRGVELLSGGRPIERKFCSPVPAKYVGKADCGDEPPRLENAGVIWLTSIAVLHVDEAVCPESGVRAAVPVRNLNKTTNLMGDTAAEAHRPGICVSKALVDKFPTMSPEEKAKVIAQLAAIVSQNPAQYKYPTP